MRNGSDNDDNNHQRPSQMSKNSKEKRRSAINATAEVQINVNGENMLVTVESLERTLPKQQKKTSNAISTSKKKQEVIA